MAVEKISLAEIENFKLDEEIRRLEEIPFEGLPDPNKKVKFKKVIKRFKDGSQKEFLFVPSEPEKEVDPNEVQAILDSLPECNEEYVRSEMERTGASVEEVIAKYLAMIELVVDNGEIPNLDGNKN